ncbi:glutamate--cysteine ligase [Pelistega ratti]|uniref:glutamate--cysteine ligase n=1 Tax=Pelistega ratti TaxID=2652177 RepID=UPI00135C3C44|nr:glutamate--cysteine ligase [Pelistega ratti]
MLTTTNLQQYLPLLSQLQRGIERETIRLDNTGYFSQTPHPIVLGSALTHPYITTDYSESLLEIITDPQPSVEALRQQLLEVHTFVQQNIPDQILWGQSMPCELPKEEDIPIAQYGSSNSGKLRHVYRQGLAVRYGKKMQCIAGLHYNFSVPDALWDILPLSGGTHQDRQNNGYMGLIRNFRRYAWLLMYLFGASPAINGSFLDEQQKSFLKPLFEGQDHTYYLPWATSLRMSDLGYKNDTQAQLKSCFNDIHGFAKLIVDAVTTSWPAYEKIGTQKNGQWIQLNTNILQIENEFYSTIRPKRTHGRGERPVTALIKHGIQYIEVRCIDINPFDPLGIDADTCYFLDTFLVFCAIKESPLFGGSGDCTESNLNFNTVVNMGRKPNLQLSDHGKAVLLKDWGISLCEQLAPVAESLDTAYQTHHYTQALARQKAKLLDASLCPSHQVLSLLQQSNTSFNETFLKVSQQASHYLASVDLSDTVRQHLTQTVQDSLIKQKEIEASDNISFEAYLQQFIDALQLN